MNKTIAESIVKSPEDFMSEIQSNLDFYLSDEGAKALDAQDPIAHTRAQFALGDIVPFAGHSLGPEFIPGRDAQLSISNIQQQQLHGGHFPGSHPEGKNSAHWFDCDREQTSLKAAKNMLGFKENSEFVFTSSGLSQNLSMLMDTFYRPTLKDWQQGKIKMVLLGTEFASDQIVAHSVAKRAIQTAVDFGVFDDTSRPKPEDCMLNLKPNTKGVYDIQSMIDVINEQADMIKLIQLSDVVFNTGQRLDLQTLFAGIQDAVEKNGIIVGLDLAHTVGNRAMQLDQLPIEVTYFVGCGYKHLSGKAGASFGFGVHRNANLSKYPPLQAWKAAASDQIFASISTCRPEILISRGAEAFRTSNPPPGALASTQAYLRYFDAIGFDKVFNKSECLTRYLILQLQQQLGDDYVQITPDYPHRGAMIAFQIKSVADVDKIADRLAEAGEGKTRFEIDVRKPNIRVTAHYGYTSFEDIYQFAKRLSLEVKLIAQQKVGFFAGRKVDDQGVSKEASFNKLIH